MIDTTEAGAGSYPEAPEDKEKCYEFTADMSFKAKITVYAESEEQARELVEKGEESDMEMFDVKIEDILEVREVDA